MKRVVYTEMVLSGSAELQHMLQFTSVKFVCSPNYAFYSRREQMRYEGKLGLYLPVGAFYIYVVPSLPSKLSANV